MRRAPTSRTAAIPATASAMAATLPKRTIVELLRAAGMARRQAYRLVQAIGT